MGVASSVAVGAMAGGPAGAAASAVASIIGEIVGKIHQAGEQVKAIILDTVAAFRPAEIELFKRAVNDLKAVFGTIFLPVLREVTAIVRQLADYFFSLPDSFKNLIANFSRIAIVASLVVTAVGFIAGAFGTFLVAVNTVVAPIAAAAAVIGTLIYAMSRSSEGANFFAKALQFVEQVLAGLQAAAAYAWQQVQPVWEELKAAAAELAKAMSELLDAIKPLAAAGLAGVAMIIRNILRGTMMILTEFAHFLTWLSKGLAAALAPLKSLGLSLPSVDREQKSARGLGTHGGNVTDILGSFRQIQEAILNFSSDADQKAKDDEQHEAIKATATNTAKIYALLAGAKAGGEAGIGAGIAAGLRNGRG